MDPPGGALVEQIVMRALEFARMSTEDAGAVNELAATLEGNREAGKEAELRIAVMLEERPEDEEGARALDLVGRAIDAAGQ
jgi:hypothetical protein